MTKWQIVQVCDDRNTKVFRRKINKEKDIEGNQKGSPSKSISN